MKGWLNNVRLPLRFRVTVKTYLFTYLLVLVVLSLVYFPLVNIIVNLMVAWFVAGVLELILNAWRKKIIHIPDSALITGTIIASVLALNTPVYFIALAVVIALLSKHFIKIGGRHIFNPANIAILILVVFLGQNTEWWAASNIYLIVLLGFFVMWQLRRFWPPLIFLSTYFLLSILVTPSVNFDPTLQLITDDFSVYYFAYVMLPEPQTAAWHPKGRYVNAMLTAFLAVVGSLFNLKAPLIVALAAVNLLTPLVNQYMRKHR